MDTEEQRMTIEQANALCAGCFPELIGVRVTHVEHGRVEAVLEWSPVLMAPNEFFHGSAMIGLAETACGLGTMATLGLERLDSFATVDLQCSFVGTARSGVLSCVAEMVHGGRTTQVWDARVTRDDGRTTALLRVTQLVLADREPPRPG